MDPYYDKRPIKIQFANDQGLQHIGTHPTLTTLRIFTA